jgi:hypothetical protein
VAFPPQTPIFHAQNAERYERQRAIKEYEETFDCRLAVLIDEIFGYGPTFLEELLFDAGPEKDLHILLWSPGGDGETAIRLVRIAQSRCRELTIVVPDQAKSAATLLAIGAHHIMMGPASDLGPVDPQFKLLSGTLAAAKDIIGAVETATKEVQQAPDTYPIHAAMLSDVNALLVQQAKSALARTDDLVEEALKSCSGRTQAQVDELKAKLRKPLIALPKSHAAVFGADDAAVAGLPIIKADPTGRQWQMIWRLWAKYFAMGIPRVYEGRIASHVMPWPDQAALGD